MSRHHFVSMKSFGDFMIGVSALEPYRDQAALVIGSHLAALSDAVGPQLDVTMVPHGDGSVPALYDIGKRGWRDAARSVATIRSAMRKADVAGPLVVDRLTLRERLLYAPRALIALPEGANIYAAYHSFAAARGWHASSASTAEAPTEDIVAVFPGSRLASKNLPPALVLALIEHIRAGGRKPRVFLLQGERPDLEAADLASEIVPRSFAAMLGAVRSASHVVSADSLPAHLAERVGRPVFVVSPVPNTYWLPASAFAHDHWGLFDPAVLRPKLHRFLSGG